MSYPNGRIPATALVRAVNGAPQQLLNDQTAAQWAAMVDAAAVDGVTLRPAADDGVSSCYRSFENQQYAWNRYQAGGPSAKWPGTSNHGTGDAVDIYITKAVLAWLTKSADLYGFDNVEGARAGEDWHWVRTKTINLPTTTTDTTEEDEDMESFIITASAQAVKYLYRPAAHSKRSISKDEWAVMRAGESAGVPLRIATVTQAELNAIPGK